MSHCMEFSVFIFTFFRISETNVEFRHPVQSFQRTYSHLVMHSEER